jgi:serine/threonine-protein kinase
LDLSLPAGAAIAGHQIERPLGRGGMGAVYLARTVGGDACALKLIDLGGDGGADLGATFKREVALCRRLDHPHIVRVLDAGVHGPLAYIAMEWVAGGDLVQQSARLGAKAPVRWAIEVARQVALALACAHERGVLHRDVKPANILVDTAARQAKLGDFGLARVADLQRSRTGVLAGTPTYMSPEQLADSVQDGRSDLYSLGAVLFELLAGRPPHQAGTLGTLLREVARVPAPDLSAFRPDLPAELAELAARLLAKHRDERPASAQTVADQLAAIGAHMGPAPGEPWP